MIFNMIKTYCDSRECQSEMFHRLGKHELAYYCMSCGIKYATVEDVNRQISSGKKTILFPSVEDESRHRDLIEELSRK